MKYFANTTHKKRRPLGKEGILLVYVLIFGGVITIMIASGLTSYALFEHRASRHVENRDIAFHIAEAGIDYYRWHLAHSPNDYQDGTGEAGPYVHDFEDKDGNVIGQFSLDITPPDEWGSVVTIRSTGYTTERPDITRTVQVRLGYPSIANFALLSNTSMIFSPTTYVSGGVMSNVGIEFNGTTNAPVQSANETYNTPSSGVQPGVWGSGGPSAFFDFPVPAQDFGAISVDLAAIQQGAIDNGLHLGISNYYGWMLDFQSNGTIDIYEVSSECAIYTYWYTWDYNDVCGTTTWSPLQTVTMPANGLIFSDDKLWVRGNVSGRVTIAAGRFPESPSTYQSVIIMDNLAAVNPNGGDVVGIIAQGNIIVPYYVPDTMTINAAAISQFGSLSRPPYVDPWWCSCGNNQLRSTLNFSGAQISYSGGGWKYGNPVITGFVTTNHTYDNNLRLNPPPGFPVGTTYEILSWEEL